MKVGKPSIAAGLVTLIAACTPGDLEIAVKRQWAESISNFGLHPVYPPREDVFIGTVRLVSEGNEPFGGASMSMGHINVARYLETSLNGLPVFPATPESSVVVTNAQQQTVYSGWIQPTDAAVQSDRLRTAALPGIAIANISAADFSANSALQALTGAYRRDANLNIALDAIETAEMDIISAVDVFESAFLDRYVLDQRFRNRFCSAARIADPERGLEGVELQMISRVFYARIIDYSYGDTLSTALRASIGAGASAQVPLTTDDLPAAVPEGQTPAATAAEPTPGSVGGTIGTESRASDGLSLRRIFERPMAFGVERIAINPYSLGFRCPEEGEFANRLISEAGSPAEALVREATETRNRVGWPNYANLLGTSSDRSATPGVNDTAVVATPLVTPPVVVSPLGGAGTPCPVGFDQMTETQQAGFAGCVQG